jgi:hypothetical protein
LDSSSTTADKAIWLKPLTGTGRQTDRATVKRMDFKHPVPFQLSETHYFNSSATNTILRTEQSKTTEIKRHILSRSHSKGRNVPLRDQEAKEGLSLIKYFDIE